MTSVGIVVRNIRTTELLHNSLAHIQPSASTMANSDAIMARMFRKSTHTHILGQGHDDHKVASYILFLFHSKDSDVDTC